MNLSIIGSCHSTYHTCPWRWHSWRLRHRSICWEGRCCPAHTPRSHAYNTATACTQSLRQSSKESYKVSIIAQLLHVPYSSPNHIHQRYYNSREYTSGSPAIFNSWLWSQNKRKADADFRAAREEQNWYSELSVHSNTDLNFCVIFLIYIL